MLTYLLRDLGGNSNSPTEMVSTALREILTTCWHNRLMKSYLHTSSDLRTRSKYVKWCQHKMSNVISPCGIFLKHMGRQNVLFDLPICYKHKSLSLIVPVVDSVEDPHKKSFDKSEFESCPKTLNKETYGWATWVKTRSYKSNSSYLVSQISSWCVWKYPVLESNLAQTWS